MYRQPVNPLVTRPRLLHQATVLALLFIEACSSGTAGTLEFLNYATTAWDVSIAGQSNSYRKRIVVPGSDGVAAARYPAFAIDAGTYIVTATRPGNAVALSDTIKVFKFGYQCAILPAGAGNLLACTETIGLGSPPSVGTVLGPR